MKLVFMSRGWSDHLYWQENDRKTLRKVNRLIEECRRHPYEGAGKPEPLKGDLSGWWSRRITVEQRLVYRVKGEGAAQQLEIVQCRYHY
jgi:toxin YoeB